MRDNIPPARDGTEELLVYSLRCLYLELETYIKLSEIYGKFTYTNEMSTICHRIGECQAYAEALEGLDVFNLLTNMGFMLERLLAGDSFVLHDIKELMKRLNVYIAELEYTPVPAVDLKEYREK